MNNSYLFTRLLLCSILLLLLNACHKPDTTDNNEYVVEKMYSYGELKNSNEYNADWQLVKSSAFVRINARTGYNSDVSFFYNNSGRLERTETISNGPPPSFTTEYTYNNQGQLITVKSIRKDGSLLSQEDYDYNGQTITRTHSVSTGDDYVVTYTVDERGNIVKAVTDNLSAGSNDYVEEWQNFDDKINMEGPVAGNVRSKNNPRRYLYYYNGRTANEYISGYTYNNAGYVTSRKDYRVFFNDINITKYELIPKR